MSRTWSPLRIATAVTLASWAAVFWFLLATGRTTLYLSTRTSWVVPMGAVVLSLAAIARLLTARTGHREILSRPRAWSLGLVVLPAVLVVALPPAALGSYAVSRRSAVSAGVVPAADVSTGQIGLIDLAAAKWSKDTMHQLIRRAGSRVTFVGFVTEESGGAADEFLLTRFIVTCCVADALSVQVRVVGAPPGKFTQDQWVEVTGSLYPVGHEMLVDASSVRAVPRPNSPYLNF